jgi:peptidoglycan/LPS O-acetylase OafA/YrhL
LKKLYSVQYLRAIAALLVIHCHAMDLQHMLRLGAVHEHFFYLENFGAIGVDIFFVISGFIISFISRSDTGGAAAKEFIKRRWIRVVPVYYIASSIFFCLMLMAPHILWDKREIIKTITLLPLLDYGASIWTPVITIGWTLGFEFFFYLLYAVLIALSVVKKDLWLVVTVTALFLLGWFFPIKNIQWEFFTSPMILEFAMGVLIAMVYKSQRKIPVALSWLLVAAGIASFVALIIFGYGEVSKAGLILDGFFVEKRILIWGAPSAMLVAGLVWLEKAKPYMVREHKWMLFLGDASYSIYLVHPICYIIVGAIFKRLQQLHIVQGDVFILMCMALSILAASLFHLYIEKPVIRKCNHLLSKTPKPV